jgi:hypothetical protein
VLYLLLAWKRRRVAFDCDQATQKTTRRLTRRDPMLLSGFHAMRWNQLDSILQINVISNGGQSLAGPAGS